MLFKNICSINSLCFTWARSSGSQGRPQIPELNSSSHEGPKGASLKELCCLLWCY